MTASTVKSDGVTNIEASPIVILDKKTGHVTSIIDQMEVAITSEDEVGDIILMCAIPSNAVILDVSCLNDALDAVADLAVDVGLYYSGIGGNQKSSGNTSGVVVDADCFASAVATLQAATTTWTSLRFEADDIADVKKEAWSVGGLSSDPGGILYVGYTVTTAAATDAAGTLVTRVDYV